MSSVQNTEIILGKTENGINVYHMGQTVNFINVLNNPEKQIFDNSPPTGEVQYTLDNLDFVVLFNYYATEIANDVINSYQGLMPIEVSPYRTVDLFKKEVQTETGVKYTYMRISNELRAQIESLSQAQQLGLYYIDPYTNDYMHINNFVNGAPSQSGGEMNFTVQYPVLYTRTESVGEIVTRTLTPLQLVKGDIHQFSFRDFNISNDRKYQYVFYPLSEGDRLVREDTVVSTKWNAWSITELHPLDSKHKNYYVENDDIWIFNLNVDTGEQTQNISRTENITLGTYPRYSQGRQNRISGQVTCLMGSDVVPLTYLEYGTAISFSPCKQDKYQEVRYFDAHPTSNEKVDMLKKWRKLVFSKNPKLLKDRKGQSFIVTITSSTNKPFDNIKNQPDTISFAWSEIQSADEITITDIK